MNGTWFLIAVLAAAATASAQEKKPAAEIPAWCAVAWHAPGTSMHWAGPRATNGGRTFRGGERLEALDVRTGKQVAAAKANGPWLDPVLGGGLVFARHQDGSVHAFAPTLDRELWQVELAPGHHPGAAVGDIFVVASGEEIVAITGGQIHWRTNVAGDVAMTPASDGKRVFVGTANGRVIALELASGKVAWERETGAQFGWSRPVVDRGTLFLADRGTRPDGKEGRAGALNAFDARTGVLTWQTIFGATGFSTPFPTEREVWAGFGRSVVRFDRATGAIDAERRIRTGQNPFGEPGVAGSALVFGNLDGSLYVHDVATGVLRWRFEVGTPDDKQQVGSWCVHEKVLVVGTTKGLFGLIASSDEPPADRVLRVTVSK